MPLRRLLLVCAATALAVVEAATTAAAGAVPVRTLPGTVRIIAVDDERTEPRTGARGPGDAGLRTEAVADVAGRLVSLPPDQAAGLSAGQRVSVTALPERDGVWVRSVDPAPPAAPSIGAGAPEDVRHPVTTRASSVLGAHRLTVLPVYWGSPDGATRATLTEVATATAAYWSAQSGGLISITPVVLDWARIADPGSCDPVALANSALAANGLPLPVSPTQHVAVYFPARDDCAGWAGLAQLGGSLIWDNGVPLVDVLAHEFGHNLGLGHANIAVCSASGARVTLSNTCTAQEYRDYADVMGAAMDRPTGNLNTALADALGLVTTVTVPAGGRASVDLAPLGQVGATRAVKIRVGSAWLYVDYRPAAAPDLREPGWAGVQLHLRPDAAYPASRLLDGQPGSAAPFSAVFLPVGRPWPVPGANLTLTVVSATGSGARITVAPSTADAAAPAPVLTAPAAGTVVGPTTTVSWRTTTDVAAQVLVDGVVRALALTPARTGSAQVTGLSDGGHVLTVETRSGAGTVTGTSAPVPVTADATPPAAPPGLRLTSAGMLSWQPAPDAGSGVACYLVALDGGAPVRVAGTTSVRVRTPSGRHTWWVVAVDRVGNVSAASGLVVVQSGSPGARAATLRVVGRVSAAAGPRSLGATRVASTLRGR
ncbi:MAG TPA: hypothetical protein VI248_23915 [Kineosporiaceae bacterium]